jgi:hypothetical protein
MGYGPVLDATAEGVEGGMTRIPVAEAGGAGKPTDALQPIQLTQELLNRVEG